METANEKWKLETKLETEMETQPPSYCSPSKISILLAFVGEGLGTRLQE